MTPRLFLGATSVAGRRLMSYRADFWITAVATFFVELAIAYFLWRAIFDTRGDHTVAGFSFEGMVLYYVMVSLVGKLVRGNERDTTVSKDIYEGALNRYLVYPAPYFGFKYAEHLGMLAPAMTQALIFGGLAALVFDVSSVGALTPASVSMAVVSIGVANLLYFLIVFAVQLVAFWADNVWSLNVMLRFVSSMLGGLLLPLALFPDWAERALSYSPFPYLFYTPVMVLVGRVGAGEWATGLAIALLWPVLMALLAFAVWRRGVLRYSGVGI